MNRQTSIFLVVATALSSQIAAQSDRDSILKKDGKDLTKIKIVKLDADKITYAKGGKEAEIAADKVKGYRFGNAPESYALGLSAANRGNHTAAAALFDQALQAAKEEAVKFAATFYCGRSFALAAAKDATHANNAVAKLQEYITAAPNGYYIQEAKVRLGQANLSGGDAAGAEAMFTTLEAESTANNWPLFWAAHVKLGKARAQYAQQKFADSRFSFQAVDGAVTAALGQNPEHNSELQNMRTEALVSQGETFVGQKMYNDALSYYLTLESNTSRGVKAAALAGRGQILYVQGSGKKDNVKLRQAQIALANASIEPDTSDATSAKALYYMGMVLMALGDSEADSRARAKAYFRSVSSTYGATEWAALARKELES